MRLGILIAAMYLLVLGVGLGLDKGWFQLPVPPAPVFDEAKFTAGIREIGVVAFFNALVPVEGKLVTDIRVRGTTYSPATRSLTVWLSAMVRGTNFIFTADCRVAEAGGWFCFRPVDIGGFIRVSHEKPAP